MLQHGTVDHHKKKQATGEGDADTHGVRYKLFKLSQHFQQSAVIIRYLLHTLSLILPFILYTEALCWALQGTRQCREDHHSEEN